MTSYTIKSAIKSSLDTLHFEKEQTLLKLGPNMRQAIQKNSKALSLFTKELPTLLNSHLHLDSTKYKIKGSIGNGIYVEIPWISIFKTSITCSAQKGIYIVFLFNADFSKVYLSLNQGMSYFKDRFNSDHPKEKLRLASKLLQRYIPENTNYSIAPIDLDAHTDRGSTYPLGHIIGKSYSIDALSSDTDIIHDIQKLIEIYDGLCNEIGNRTIDEFYDYLFDTYNGYIPEECIPSKSTPRISLQEHLVCTEDIIDSTAVLENDDIPSQKKDPIKSKSGKIMVPRSKVASERALILAGYKCEYDPSHISFQSKRTNTNYAEAHHLIPLSHYYDEKFDHSIDVSSNIVSLCPTCHKCIHLGSDAEKLLMLKKLLSNDRKKRLLEAGIIISVDELEKIYEINIFNTSSTNNSF